MPRITFPRIPYCATFEQYAAWRQIARRVMPSSAGFCEDCTPEYAVEMRLQGRCEHPEIIFDEHGNGCVPTAYRLNKLNQEQA